MIRWFAAALLTLMCFAAGPVRAESDEAGRAEIVGIRLGFSGRYKVGLWTPVEIRLRGVEELADGMVRLIVPDSDGVSCGVTAPLPCPAAAGEPASDSQDKSSNGETKVFTYARLGRRRGDLTVELSSSGRVVAKRVFSTAGANGSDKCPPALFLNQDLIVTVGPKAMGVEGVVGDASRRQEERPVVVRITDTAELPDRWYGYESVRLVILSTSDLSICSSLQAQVERIEALGEWVRMGGRLVFCAGENAGDILGGGGPNPLEGFAPGKLREMRSLTDAHSFGVFGGGLESYCGSLKRLRVPRMENGRRLEFQIPLLADVEGVIECGDEGMPLVVRRAVGFGQIVFLAGDLDRAPLESWPDRPLLLRGLLDLPENESESVETGSALAHFGYSDLSGQLRSGLDRFTGIWQVPVSLVIGLIVVYLLAIGPGDYFLLRWMGRRMGLTWLTFPALVILFSVGAYVLAHRSKGDQLRVNQVDLVDVDVESGQLRGTSWANVFSPAMQRYDITFEASTWDPTAASEADVLVSWLGLPGKGLGGMDPTAGGPAGWTRGYDFSPDLDRMLQVPIPIWATKSVTARWTTRGGIHPEANLKDSGQMPVGMITNTLDFPLDDCLLAYGNWAYDLGTLRPGDSARMGPIVMRRELNSLLTGRKQVFDREDEIGRERVTPYDRESFDVAYILRAMMFYDAANGQRYTGLSNSYQAFVDLSGLLKANRAVLIASIGDESAAAELGGAELVVSPHDQPAPQRQTRHDTIVRFVFSVESE